MLQVQTPTGDTAENVLHFYKGSNVAWTSTELTTLANGLDTWSTTGDGSGDSFVAQLPTTDTMVAIVCRDLTTQTGPEITKVVSHAGLNTNPAMADGLTKAFTLRSGMVGRSNRGRVYVIHVCTNELAAGTVNSMSATDLTARIAAWNSLIAATVALNAAWYWCVLSRQQNKIILGSGVGVKIQSVGYSHVFLDYQRRRAPGHGRHA